MLSTTAWDPHLWVKWHSALLLHLPKLKCWQISWPALWVARSMCTRWWSSACWCGGEPAWNWLLPCMKGLMCDTPHQHVRLQHIPAKVLQLVHSCSLPRELSYLKAAAIGCEELADDVLVLHPPIHPWFAPKLNNPGRRPTVYSEKANRKPTVYRESIGRRPTV